MSSDTHPGTRIVGPVRRRSRNSPARSASDTLVEAESTGRRRDETPIARAVRRQQGPPFREVTIELPFHDAGFLETTIVYPSTHPEPSNPLVRSTNAIAILLHPWSRVGGNAYDPVLLSFVSIFLRREYHVIVYNSRGVGNSGGSASWTGFSEAQDLQVVVDLVLREIEAVDEIVLLGYSYGSLAASLHPARPPSFFNPASLARNPHVSPDLRIRHILLSYPVGVLWLLTFFHSGSYINKLHELVTSPGADVLVLYGERDQFTKKEKYQRWASDLRAAFNSVSMQSTTSNQTASSDPTTSNIAPDTTSSSATPFIPIPKLSVHVVPEADHFWRTTRGSIREARSIVEEWLDTRRHGVEPAMSPVGAGPDPPELSSTSAASSTGAPT